MKHLSIDITNYVIHIKGRKEETQQIAFVLNVSRKTVTEVLPLVFKVDVYWKICLNLDFFIYKGNSVTYYACSNQQKYAHLKKATSLMKTGLVKCLTDPVKLRWNVNGVKIESLLLKNVSYFLNLGPEIVHPPSPSKNFS